MSFVSIDGTSREGGMETTDSAAEQRSSDHKAMQHVEGGCAGFWGQYAEGSDITPYRYAQQSTALFGAPYGPKAWDLQSYRVRGNNDGDFVLALGLIFNGVSEVKATDDSSPFILGAQGCCLASNPVAFPCSGWV